MKNNLNILNNLISDAIKDGYFPGGNYCLVENNNIHLDSLGLRAIFPEKEKNDLNTVYDMASCTKVVVTTTSIFLLMEAGKLRLFDNVKKYIPELKYDNITVFDLMTHTSGYPAGIFWSKEINTRKQVLDQIYSLDIKYEKNSKILYSDIGFILLGILIENISGLNLSEFAELYIFKPLDMNNSCFNPKNKEVCAPTEIRDNVITRGDVHDERAYTLGGVAGHAGLFSTVEDISHFIMMILNEGNYNGKQFLSKATIDLMFTPQVRELNGINLIGEQRGLGWIIKGSFSSAGDLASPETILHTGFTGTNIFIDRINKVGFSLLTNRVHPTRDNIKIIAFRAKIGNFVISHFGGKN